MINTIADILVQAKMKPGRRMVLVNGVDRHSLEAAYMASEMGLVKVMITGSCGIIEAVCREIGISTSEFQIIPADDESQAAQEAAKLVSSGEADLLMKGLISSDKYMRALLNKEYGLLSPGSILSHVAVVENENYHKLLIVSDVAVIPYPDLNQKTAMIKSLIRTGNALGIERPKVALIAPSEQVLPALPATTDAALLVKMAMTGEISGGIIDGPMALDVAIDAESAVIKNIHSPVAGDADCLLFPNIDAGNVFYKMNTKLCNSRQAAVVVGAKVPVVLSSRGDSTETKLNSIALASLLSNQSP
ncbi:MAG: phosphate acyltransferase [Mangrovibacterium sp.]